MYCSLDKIDLAARIDGQPVAIQTDHRSRAEIEAEPELTALYAMARVLNARSHLAADGDVDAAVHYVVADEPPPVLREALAAAGAVIERADRGLEPLGAASEEAVAEVADRAFAALARRAAVRVGVRDLAIALRMLEDQTFANPPAPEDEEAYWARVLELAALTGELLRAKAPSPSSGRWVQTERALVPFGFQLAISASGGTTVVFPTNRAQRVIEDGPDETLFKLLLAAEETMQRPLDAADGRLMPSLRDRRMVELDEVLWHSVLSETAGPPELPIVVCGVDGESTFGMIRRDALGESAPDAMDEALRNLEAEAVQTELYAGDGFAVLAVTGSFYAAEKVLDRAFMRSLHDRLGADLLAAAVPTRGLLMVTAAHHEPARLARFAALARMRHDDAGGRAISPTVLLVSEGRVAGFVRDATADRPDPEPLGGPDDYGGGPEPGEPAGACDDACDDAREGSREAGGPGFLRRLLGRKRAP